MPSAKGLEPWLLRLGGTFGRRKRLSHSRTYVDIAREKWSCGTATPQYDGASSVKQVRSYLSPALTRPKRTALIGRLVGRLSDKMTVCYRVNRTCGSCKTRCLLASNLLEECLDGNFTINLCSHVLYFRFLSPKTGITLYKKTSLIDFVAVVLSNWRTHYLCEGGAKTVCAEISTPTTPDSLSNPDSGTPPPSLPSASFPFKHSHCSLLFPSWSAIC